jgi:hypothetical protein
VAKKRATDDSVSTWKDKERTKTMRYAVVLLIAALSGCAINYHVKPDGDCKSSSNSQFSSTCSSPEDSKQIPASK